MRNKKKLPFGMFILGIIGFLVLSTGSVLTMAKGNQDLLTLATIIKSENIDIYGWSLHAREKGTTSKA